MPSKAMQAALGALQLVGFVASSSLPQEDSPLSIKVHAKVPDSACDTVSRDFAGLGFEQSSFVRYAQDDSGNPNKFSANLMDSIYTRTGGKPIIRLGGTSPDYGKYLPDQKEPALPVAEVDNYQDVGHTTIGPSYWPLTKNFPNAKYMIQVPLATTNKSETVEWAKTAVNAIGLDKIHTLQIGNEPNLYGNDYHGENNIYLGPPDYQGTLSNETYVGNYTAYAKKIRDEIDLPDHFFTAFDVAATVNNPAASEYTFEVETCFGLGIDNDNIIAEAASHYYQNNAGGAEDLESGLMDVSFTHMNLDYRRRNIDWLKKHKPDVTYVINEIGNSLSTTHSYVYQARLGSALWLVEWTLYALTIGVQKFNYQMIMHSGFDLWLPVHSAGMSPRVFASYYALPFLADFIGSSGKTRVSQADIKNGDSAKNLAAYVAYDDGEAKRIAIANLDYWNSTSSGTDRPHEEISIKVPSGVKQVKVTHLNSELGAGAATDTITYAGSKWTYDSEGKEVKGKVHDTKKINVSGGVAKVKVASSEAVLVYL